MEKVAAVGKMWKMVGKDRNGEKGGRKYKRVEKVVRKLGLNNGILGKSVDYNIISLLNSQKKHTMK